MLKLIMLFFISFFWFNALADNAHAKSLLTAFTTIPVPDELGNVELDVNHLERNFKWQALACKALKLHRNNNEG